MTDKKQDSKQPTQTKPAAPEAQGNVKTTKPEAKADVGQETKAAATQTKAPTEPTSAAQSAPPSAPAAPPSAAKGGGGGGKGIAIFALLVALAAGGGSGYVWYLWDSQRKADAATQEARLKETLTKIAAQQDTELKNLRSDLQAHEGDLEVKQENLDSLRGDAQILRADIQTLQGESQVHKGDIRGLQGDIQTLKGSLETQKGAVEIQKSDTRTLQTDIRTLQGDIQALQSGIQNLRSGIDGQKGDLLVRQKEVQALQDETQALQGNLQTLVEKLGNQGQAQEKAVSELSDRLENLQLAHRGLLTTLEAVKEVAARGGDVNAFALSEVEYLLRMADYKLKFEQDIQGAIAALTTAEQRLKGVDESAFIAVTRMIAEDIASLRGVDLPDHSALAHKIAEMAGRVEKLALRNELQIANLKEKVKPHIGEGKIDLESEVPWWEQATANAWSELKDMVIIRNERSSGPPLIAVEEKYFLIQNLRLELEAMRLALLNNDASSYQESNELARNWMQTYFNTDDESTASLLSELKALQTIEFNPYIPDVSGTLRAFRDIMARRSPIRSVANPTVPQEADAAATGETQQ